MHNGNVLLLLLLLVVVEVVLSIVEFAFVHPLDRNPTLLIATHEACLLK
jgi:hypothetical protein